MFRSHQNLRTSSALLCVALFNYPLTDAYADALRQRREKFRQLTRTKKQLFNTLITTYPVKHSPASIGQIDQVITMDSLFKYESFY